MQIAKWIAGILLIALMGACTQQTCPTYLKNDGELNKNQQEVRV